MTFPTTSSHDRLLLLILSAIALALLASHRVGAQIPQIRIESLHCEDTTEAGADEIYVLVQGVRSDGLTVSYRAPTSNTHWDMNDNSKLPVNNKSGDAQIRTDLVLFPEKKSVLKSGQSWELFVVIMEEDGGNSERWQKAIAAAALKSKNPYGVAAGAILSVYTSLFGSIVDDTDDVIGSFTVRMTTGKDGKLSVQWKPVDSVVGVYTYRNGFEYEMNGDGSFYKVWVMMDELENE